METLKVWIFDKLGVQPKEQSKKDGFVEGEDPLFSGVGMLVVGLIVLAICLIFGIGAAKLSWCYNSSLGTGTGLKLFYGFFAYIFSSFYYPYYAFFLDDSCAVSAITNNSSSRNNSRSNAPKMNNRPANQTGGSRRR